MVPIDYFRRVDRESTAGWCRPPGIPLGLGMPSGDTCKERDANPRRMDGCMLFPFSVILRGLASRCARDDNPQTMGSSTICRVWALCHSVRVGVPCCTGWLPSHNEGNSCVFRLSAILQGLASRAQHDANPHRMDSCMFSSVSVILSFREDSLCSAIL